VLCQSPLSTQRGQYKVTSKFTVFRHRDKAPKHLKLDVTVMARELLGDPVSLEIASEFFESGRDGFSAYTDAVRE
jgi:hypothetical protein